MLIFNVKDGEVSISLGGETEELVADVSCLALGLGDLIRTHEAFVDYQPELMKVIPFAFTHSEDEATALWERLFEESEGEEQ